MSEFKAGIKVFLDITDCYMASFPRIYLPECLKIQKIFKHVHPMLTNAWVISSHHLSQDLTNKNNIVAAFRGMHVSPAKHSYAWLPRKCDYQESVTTGRTDRQTDAGQSDPYVPLCFAGDTKRSDQIILLALLLTRFYIYNHIWKMNWTVTDKQTNDRQSDIEVAALCWNHKSFRWSQNCKQ